MKDAILIAICMLLLVGTVAGMLATCEACREVNAATRQSRYHRTAAERAEAIGWQVWQAEYADTREMLRERSAK